MAQGTIGLMNTVTYQLFLHRGVTCDLLLQRKYSIPRDPHPRALLPLTTRVQTTETQALLLNHLYPSVVRHDLGALKGPSTLSVMCGTFTEHSLEKFEIMSGMYDSVINFGL